MTEALAVRVMTALIVLLMVVNGVALATVDEASTAAPAGETTDAGAPVPGQSGPDGGAATSAPAPGAAGAPAGSPEGAGAAEPAPTRTPGGVDYMALPERPGPPRAGKHDYRSRFDGQASFGPMTTRFDEEQTMTFEFAPAPAPPGETRDRRSSAGSGSSGGFDFSGSSDDERAWRGDGMYVMSSRGSAEAREEDGPDGDGFSGECQWQPPKQELAFPLRPGTQWSWDSRCDSKTEDGEVRRRSRGSAKVTGSKTAAVGGKEVRVLVIEMRSTEEVETEFRDDEGRSYNSSTVIDSQGTELFAPSVSLSVRSEVQVKGTSESPQAPGQQGRFEGKSTSELLNLDPKKN